MASDKAVILPSHEEVRHFYYREIDSNYGEFMDTDDVAIILENISRFVEKYVRLNLCLTGQEEFTIFQREEQAPKETPRPE